MAIIKTYSIDELLAVKEDYKFIIDKWLYLGDTALIKARSKTGKSVLAQQMAYSVSCGEPFLGHFDVSEPISVCVIAGEGFMGDWKNRFINMGKMWKYDKERIKFVHCTFMQLHKPDGATELLRHIRDSRLAYKLFIFDPLMFLSIGGSYNNDTDVNTFFANVELIKREYGASAIVIHHDSEKDIITKGGKRISAANQSTSMGSSAINAVITQSYTVEKHFINGKKIHKIKTSNNRASWMIQEIDLIMIVPEEDELGRLGYSLDSNDDSSAYYTIKGYIETNIRVSDHKLSEILGIPSSTLYRNLNKLKEAKLISKLNEGGKGYYVWQGTGTVPS